MRERLRYLRRMVHARVGARCMYHWCPDPARDGIRRNFGDELVARIVARILGRTPRLASRDHPVPKVLAGGSVLAHARDFDTLWGVGLRQSNGSASRRLDVRAVRGPLTRDFLVRSLGVSCPEIYGDPALLLPSLFPEWRALPSRGCIGVVPHFRNQGRYAELPPGMTLIRPDRAPESVVRELLRCELVISASLHGIIVAEAFGIPARWLADDGNGEPHLKYYDYYLSTNRSPRAARSLAQAEDSG